MVAIERPIEQRDLRDPHRVDDRTYFFAIRALGEVRHAFDDCLVDGLVHGVNMRYFHQVKPTENCALALTPGLESPKLAFEICTAFAEKSIDSRGRKK